LKYDSIIKNMKPNSFYSPENWWMDEHQIVHSVWDILKRNPSGYVPWVHPNQITGEEEYKIAMQVLDILYSENEDTIFIWNNHEWLSDDRDIELAVWQANMILRTSRLVRIESIGLIMCWNFLEDQLFIQEASSSIGIQK